MKKEEFFKHFFFNLYCVFINLKTNLLKKSPITADILHSG